MHYCDNLITFVRINYLGYHCEVYSFMAFQR